MYKSDLHAMLIDAIKASMWIRSTKDEDNYRQVVCSQLYRHVSPNNVEIPSTRSSHGDIKIFDRKIELKYASINKIEKLDTFLVDFQDLLEGRIEFSILAIRVGDLPVDRVMHRVVTMPMLSASSTSTTFGVKTLNGKSYNSLGIFLSATYLHPVRAVKLRNQPGKNSTAYLSFEQGPNINRSSLLETSFGIVHVDVIGSADDGFLSYIFKRADNVILADATNNPPVALKIPHSHGDKLVAMARIVNVHTRNQKRLPDQSIIEERLWCYQI